MAFQHEYMAFHCPLRVWWGRLLCLIPRVSDSLYPGGGGWEFPSPTSTQVNTDAAMADGMATTLWKPVLFTNGRKWINVNELSPCCSRWTQQLRAQELESESWGWIPIRPLTVRANLTPLNRQLLVRPMGILLLPKWDCSESCMRSCL